MNVIELLDTSWIDGTHNVQVFPDIGSIEIVGNTYPEIVPHLVKFEQEGLQSWKFGVILTESNKNLVLLFGKRDPRGWHGNFST